MMTRLVVVMRDAGNSAAEDAQTCRVPAPCERDSFVFTATECGPLRLRNFYARHFRPAVARARLPKQLRFHDLRHPCAALLIANGRHMEEMKDHLGHSSIRVTSDRCGHLFPRAPQETPTGSTRLTGMQPRPAGPTCGRYATSASPEHAGRSESLNRAFSGGCEYPVEEPPPKRALEESEAGGQDRGLPPCSVGPPSDTADESGAGRIRPAASGAYAHRGLGTGNRAWRPQIAPLGDAHRTPRQKARSRPPNRSRTAICAAPLTFNPAPPHRTPSPQLPKFHEERYLLLSVLGSLGTGPVKRISPWRCLTLSVKRSRLRAPKWEADGEPAAARTLKGKAHGAWRPAD